MQNKAKIIKQYSSLIKSMIDSKLSDDSSVTNSYTIHLTDSEFKFILHEPSTSILNYELKNRIEEIITTGLYPQWVVKHEPGLNLVPVPDADPDSARALVFKLHFGLYKRLKVVSLTDNLFLVSNGKDLGIELMKDYVWLPDKYKHLAIQAVTTAGKSTFLEFLLVNTAAFTKKKINLGAFNDNFKNQIVIDPKKDPFLKRIAESLGADYISPDFQKSDADFVQSVCDKLKQVSDLVHSRADMLDKNPELKFKDVWLFIDELLAIPELANKKQKELYISLINRLLLMSASVNVHLITAAQSYIAGASISSQARLQFSMRILLTSRVNAENSSFLFKELDSDAINNLVLDVDEFGSLGVGIASQGAGEIIPFKAPYIEKR